MPAPIDAPPAPPAGVRIVSPSTPPKPPPAPTREIKLSAPRDPGPLEPPKPGTARERLSQSLYKKAGAAPPEPPAPDPNLQVKPPGNEPPDDLNAPPPPDDPALETDPNALATEKTPVAPAGEKTKTNPWKIVDQWKTKAGELEKQLAEAKTAALPEKQKTEFLTRIEELQKRNTELEDEMRFVNYSKSKEFTETFDIPYKKAFEAAVEEMSEITVTDATTGAVRQIGANDIAALANMNLADARKHAKELNEEFADDLMNHRKEIRDLYKKRQTALEEARTKGAEREKQKAELNQKTQLETQDFIARTWKSVNDSAVKHETYGKFFTPIEGDQDGNQRLAKGFELVDRAFSENPNAPGLSQEQRASIIARHAAVRNRAAATGRLISWLNQRDAKIAELEKELGQYRATTPGTGGTPPAPGGTTPADGERASNRVFGALRKLAH